jgi:hypothetical protein
MEIIVAEPLSYQIVERRQGDRAAERFRRAETDVS